MKIKITAAAALLLLMQGTVVGAFEAKDSAGWWEKQYGTVSAADDPLVARAEKVFQKVAAAADKSSAHLPRLTVVKGSGDPYAAAIRDGSIILTEGGIQLCYRGVAPEAGDARLAFVLGHELVHQARGHFWHQAAFESVQAMPADENSRDRLLGYLRESADVENDAKVKELQADAEGLIYAAMAGYAPQAVLAPDGSSFLDDWVAQVTGRAAYQDRQHATPRERAAFMRSQIAPVVRQLDYFHLGVRLYQLGRYRESLLFLDRFREYFPSREVFSNLGLVQWQLAMGKLGECDPELPLRFKLSIVLDTETIAGGLLQAGATRGTATTPAMCYQDAEFKSHMAEAVKHLEVAVSKDPTYLPARLNLSSALILSGDYPRALSVTDQALQIKEGYPPAVNNLGVALHLLSTRTRTDTRETSLGVLRNAALEEGFAAPLYNMAVVLMENRDEAGAKVAWGKFLQVEGRGAFAAAARRRLGTLEPAEKRKQVQPALASPVPLGKLSEQMRKTLPDMEKRELPTGTVEGAVYRGNGMTVYLLDQAVALVETERRAPERFEEFRKVHGEPLREVASQARVTHIYRSFAVDVVDGRVVKVVYY